MPKATIPSGDLVNLKHAYLYIPNYGRVYFYTVPELTDGKSAVYNDEPIIGRSFPLKTYSHSENRAIGLTLHMHARKKADINTNLEVKRAIESCLYPREDETKNAPFLPPVVCQLKIGKLLASNPICVVLKSYNTSYPTDVPWDEDTYLPWKFDISTSWEPTYKSASLPGQYKILNFGG